jgi:hypothetical protein
MSNPSFLNVPYRFKAGTLYSQIPESGLGDLTVTRATTPTANRSTRVNASGLIELVNDNVPRLDYPLGGIANGCPGLLVEPAATNLTVQSENFGTTWGLVQLLAFGSGSVLNTTATLDPYGTNLADFIVANTVLDQHRVEQTTASAAGSYTFSVFLKAGGYGFGRLRIGGIGATFNLTTGAVSSTDTGIVSSIQSYGNGWYRCIISKAASIANEIVRVNILQSGSGDFAGNGTSGIYIFGSQYELGAVATSYIPTTTQAITRGAETISKTGVSSLIGQTEGTIYWEGSFAQAQIAAGQDGFQIGINASNYIYFGIVSGRPYFRLRANAINAVTIFPLGNVIQNNQKTKIAIAYKSGDSALFVNGTQIGSTNTTAFTFASSLSVVEIGSSLSSSSAEGFSNSPKKPEASALFPTRLTNAQLQALTT